MTVLVFEDAERVTIDVLKAELAARDALDYVTEDLTVSVDYPSGDPDAPTVPHLQVVLDGTPTVAPAAEFATVRITAWGVSRTSAKNLAALAKAVLDAHGGNGDVWGFKPLTGPQPSDDPETGHPMCSLTMRVSVRAHPEGGIP